MDSKNYVDTKVTVWQRLHFDDSANMENVIEVLKRTGNTNDICDDMFGFRECETLYDSETHITPAQNDGNATLEIYNGNSYPEWQNAIALPEQHILKAVKGIDWNMLKDQKLDLLEALNIQCLSDKQHQSLTGILHLIDAIQDGAIDDGIATKKEVFNSEEEEG